jgi:hypothetical protein
MKLQKRASEIVFFSFVILLIVIAVGSNSSITGNVVLESNPMITLDNKEGLNTYTLALSQDMNQEFKLGERDKVVLRAGSYDYEITILRIKRDYELALRFTTLSIVPGDKIITLQTGKEEMVDLNNDGKAELKIKIKDLRYDKAILLLTS